MSNHTEWRRSFPDLVRVAHSGDTRDPVEMELQGNGPWEASNASRKISRVEGG